MGLLDFDTVSLDEAAGELVLIDQTLLPGRTQWLRLTKSEDIFEAILSLRVRGAPAIGVAAAMGLYVCALRLETTDALEFRAQVHAVKEYLASARPTAVNLTWALNRMERALPASGSVENLKEALLKEARAIRDEDIAVCRKLGEYGLTLLKDGDGILTHCNAGQLATVRYGTALAPIHVGREQGYRFRMFCDETRPLLQGARLSAYEMMEAGMETTVLCDNMAASLLASGQVQAVIVGCDRVAANGDAANKIGTMGLAILAKRFEVPFYVAAPTSTIDFACPDGQHIVIEQRAPEEVTRMWYLEPMAPAGVQAYNPAFDVTPHELITAIITEHGVLRPSYSEAIAKLPGGREHGQAD